MIDWIINFLVEYVNTPTYLHTLGMDALFILIIGVLAIIFGAIGFGVVLIIWKIKKYIEWRR